MRVERHPSIIDLNNLTKLTKVTRLNEIFQLGIDNDELFNELAVILNRMIDEGKTDGGPWITDNPNPDHVVLCRRWVDQAAAEEWMTILQEAQNRYQLPILSYEIVDNPFFN